jgi:hypothetical protein
MQTATHIPVRARRQPWARRPRRPAFELSSAAALLAVLAIAFRPGIGLGAVLAALVVAARAFASGAIGAWRRAFADGGRRRRRGRAGPARRAVSVVTAAAALTLCLAALSYVSAMTGRSNSSLGIRTVEWLRDNGAAGVVSFTERVYYTLTAPAKGGPGLHRLPQVGFAGLGTAQPRKLGYRPPDLAPVIRPRLRGEGVWRATQRRFAADGAAPVMVTTYRPDPSYPRVVAGVARIDPRRTRIALYPGLAEPPGASGSAEVPPALRRGLLATFNSGFKHKDGGGGFFSEGRLLEPMQPGLATLVAKANGRVDVRAWHGGARPGRAIVLARQNLPLIVDHGRPNPGLNDGPQWGFTLGNSMLVWRSGVGVDSHRDLIYAAAPDQTVRGLAGILIHAGAVRAMEFDINSYWVTFNTYAKSAGRHPSKLLSAMSRPADRYMSPDDRDFFAVYAR